MPRPPRPHRLGAGACREVPDQNRRREISANAFAEVATSRWPSGLKMRRPNEGSLPLSFWTIRPESGSTRSTRTTVHRPWPQWSRWPEAFHQAGRTIRNDVFPRGCSGRSVPRVPRRSSRTTRPRYRASRRVRDRQVHDQGEALARVVPGLVREAEKVSGNASKKFVVQIQELPAGRQVPDPERCRGNLSGVAEWSPDDRSEPRTRRVGLKCDDLRSLDRKQCRDPGRGTCRGPDRWRHLQPQIRSVSTGRLDLRSARSRRPPQVRFTIPLFSTTLPASSEAGSSGGRSHSRTSSS